MLLGLFVLFILAGMCIAANFALQDRQMFALLAITIHLGNAIFILLGLLMLLSANIQLAAIEAQDAIIALMIFTATAVLGWLVLLPAGRLWLARFFPKRHDSMMTPPANDVPLSHRPIPPALYGYDPTNPVHMLALIFAVWLVGIQLGSVALAGGLGGIADDIPVDWLTLITNFLPQVVVPLLGVGLFMRRDWSETRERLGFHAPRHPLFPQTIPGHLETLLIGVGSAIGMVVLVILLSMVWQAVVSPETYESQTEASQAMAESINTLWLALGVALMAAVGEEIAFRGALQPIFGFWATAFIFTVVHVQYTLTPASLIIFVVALMMGRLREQYNLYAAIIAHFAYNFVLLLGAVYG